MKILVKGWVQVPHSYAIVNCFQMLALSKIKGVDIYIQEQSYFNPKWNDIKNLDFYPEKDKMQLEKLLSKKLKGDPDIIYSITFPYDIIPEKIPKVTFFTSEFRKLDYSYFNVKNEKFIKDAVFHCPSEWSKEGMEYSFGKKSRVITHGIDLDIFKRISQPRRNELRSRIRKQYGIKDDEIVLLNIGSMTANKGIMVILQLLSRLDCKLILKGSGDLYESKKYIEYFIDTLVSNGILSISQINDVTDKVIFVDKMFTFEQMNELYNTVDYYISPYLAEGFNLAPLECIAAGTPVIIPQTGSTKEYINDIYNNHGSQMINYIDSKVISTTAGFQNSLDINIDKIIDTMTIHRSFDVLAYNQMRQFLQKDYSWDTVAIQLFNFLKEVKNNGIET